VPCGDQDLGRVAAERQRGDARRGERGPADVQAPVGKLLVLAGHAGLDLLEDDDEADNKENDAENEHGGS
jgi:hypothetical protein